MTKLNLDVSVVTMINMADGLMRRGNTATAADLYAIALKDAPPEFRQLILVRQGLAGAPTQRISALHRVLTTLEGFGQNTFIGTGLATWQKTTGFFEDERFVALMHKHRELMPLANWHWNLEVILWAVRQAKGVEGDFVELGVFKGHTTLFAAEYLDFQTWDQRWYLYDTFEGIPDDQVDPGWEEVNKNVYGGTFGFEEVRDRFAEFPNIEVIKGRVPEILAEVSPPKIAFLHVDLNNTTAEIAALDALYDRISPGGVIVFDDYGWITARAQHDAENRWFAAKGLHILPLPTGQGLFVKPA